MIYDVVAALFAVTVLVAPVVLLTRIIDRLFDNGSLRAIVRRAFRIDPAATLADAPSRPAALRRRG
jgi:hypothetical protein